MSAQIHQDDFTATQYQSRQPRVTAVALSSAVILAISLVFLGMPLLVSAGLCPHLNHADEGYREAENVKLEAVEQRSSYIGRRGVEECLNRVRTNNQEAAKQHRATEREEDTSIEERDHHRQ